MHVLAFLSSHVGHCLSIFFAPTPSNFAIALTLRFVDNRLLCFPLSILPAPKKRKENLLKNLSICFLQISCPLQMCLLQISCQLEIERSSNSRGLDFCDAISSIASERERSPQLHPPPRSMDEISLIHPSIFISIFLLLYLYQPVFF